MQKKSTTIHDIAKELNLDPSTVSRGLRGSNRVTKKTKERILVTAKKMGYSQNVIASNLRKGKTKTIGLIVPSINMYFFSGIIHGVEEILSTAGFNLLICQSNEDMEIEKNNVDVLLKNRVDGVLISISSLTDDYDHIRLITENLIPLVQFDRVVNDIGNSFVLNDNEKACYEATKHLIERGYRKIVHFTGPKHLNIYQERIKGYRRAIREFPNGPLPEKIVKATNDKEGYKAVANLLDKGVEFDGICTTSDLSAIGAMRLLKDRNIRVPEDVGITGFANEPFTDMLNPSLTSMDQFNVQMGRTAANLIIDKIRNDNVMSTQTIVLNSQLIERESSAGKKHTHS